MTERRRLVGRDREIRALRETLEWEGAAQVLGPPGIGKTALVGALEPDGRVDLEGVRTARELQSRVARAVGSAVDREGAALQAAGAFTLLLLDAAEELEPSAVGWVERLRERAAVVLTSRRRLPGLPALELGPLEPAAGAALLRARVGSVQQAAALDQEALEGLSAAVDGVPLVLELVAPRLRVRSARALGAVPLEELLGGSGAGLLDQVRRVVAGLDGPEWPTLKAAAVIPGAFSVELLEGMVGAPVEEGVLRLVDAGVLHSRPGERPTLQVLAPIRAVVEGALAQSEREALLDALADAVLGRAEGLGMDAVPLLERVLESSRAHTWLRAARALAALERRAGPQEATVERDLRRPVGGPRELWVAWAMDVAAAASHLGRLDEAEAALARAEPLLEGAERPRWQALWAGCLAARGRVDEALELARSAAAEGEDPVVDFRLGGVCFRAGAHAEAVDAFRRAREGADAFRRAQATYGLAVCLRESGEVPERILQEVAEVGVDLDDPELAWLAPRFRTIAGVLHGDAGELHRAREELALAASGLRGLGEHDDALGQWLNVELLGLALGEAGEGLLDPLDPPPGPAMRPVVELHRALVHGLHGRVDASRAIALPALGALERQRDLRHAELGATWAAVHGALDPDGARAVLDGLPDHAPLVGLARRRLEGERPEPGPRMEQRILVALADRVAASVRVSRDGSGFAGVDGAVVDIRRRRVLRRVLEALARAGEPLDVGEICAAVWPGEALVGDSGTRRVHVAISTLRGLGLRDAIRTVVAEDGATGWVLDAERVEEL